MNNLKDLREKRGLTQAQVASAARISQQAYSLLETGQNNPSLETALYLSKLFLTPVEEIFLGKKSS